MRWHVYIREPVASILQVRAMHLFSLTVLGCAVSGYHGIMCVRACASENTSLKKKTMAVKNLGEIAF